jgi:hypothetical protein
MVLLLAAGGAAAIEGWREREAVSADAAERAELRGRVDRLLAAIADLGTVQAGYVAPSADPAQPFEQFPARLRDVSAGVAVLSAAARSPGGTRALQQVADAMSVVAQADARARDDLLLGDVVAASNVIFTESVPALASMRASLQAFRTEESSARNAARAAGGRRMWTVLGGAALVWAAGLLMLVPLPRAASNGRRVAPDAAAPPLDLAAAAGLCTALARVESAADLAGLLDRAMALLDAAGMIVWTRAGDEMVPVATRGYDPASASMLTPIRRDDDHATARAWREGAVQCVEGRDGLPGALAAPLWSPRGCSGVLTVETRNGAESDPTTRAAVEMIAAQLSNIVTGSDTPVHARATGT